MGGRLKSRRICCNACNSAISTKESAVRNALRHAFASVGAVNDDREPTEIRFMRDGREFVLADGNAVLQETAVRFDPINKRVVVPLPAGLDAQAQRCAKAMWSQGLTADDVDSFHIEPGDPDPVLPAGPTVDEYDLRLGRQVEHRQVFVKMALELLAFHRHDFAVRDELSAARHFARYGEGIDFRARFDTRSRGSGLIPEEALPEVFNVIEIWTFGYWILFRVVFLGPLVFTGALTSDWSGEAFRAAYAFDARDPAKTIASAFGHEAGRPLSTWLIRNEVRHSADTLEAISGRLAVERARNKPEREPPPDIDALRAAIRKYLAEMPPKKKAKKDDRSEDDHGL
jgi:hypothetical protein